MISQNPNSEAVDEVQVAGEDAAVESPPYCVVLARYGTSPQVARFGVSESLHSVIADKLHHRAELVVQTDRGPEIASLLEMVRDGIITDDKPVTGDVLRLATSDDRQRHQQNRRKADLEFFDWQTRLTEWQLQLQLIDLEWTLDEEQLILYVLNGQDAETTRLALLAAAAGLGIVHVQPVAAEGVVQTSGGGGGCGSGGGGCGSGGCG